MMLDVHATEEEDKLVLLASLDRLGRCTKEQLLRFVVETELQSQFQFAIALAGLYETGHVRESERLEGKLLVLTPEGRQSLEMFGSRIRASLQEKLETHGASWRRRIREEQQMPADWEETEHGFTVTLRTIEAGAEIVNIRLTVADKQQAKRFCARWRENAPFLYQTLMDRLGETHEEDKP
jgi:hypothetical protein